MPLRSFRPPPNLCVHCGQLQDPDLPRSRIGCLVLIPVALVTALAFGTLGFAAGRILNPTLNIQDLDKLLAIIAAFDGLGVVAIVHVRQFRGPAEQHLARPVAAFLMYALIGAKCVRRMGVNAVLLASILNAAVASFVTIGILSQLPSSTARQDKTK